MRDIFSDCTGTNVPQQLQVPEMPAVKPPAKSEPELKPCPFCGHKARLTNSGLKEKGYQAPASSADYSTTWTVECSYCGTKKGPYRTEYYFTNNGELIISGQDGRLQVAAKWNERAEKT